MNNNQNVLITGGNKGIGLATTEKFLNTGNTVIIVARKFNDFSLRDTQG